MRSKASIQSILKSHPGLEGLLPAEGATSGITNILTTSMKDSKARVDSMRSPIQSSPVTAAGPLLTSTESDAVTAALNSDASKYVESIMTTGGSLVSIPHVHRTATSDVMAAEALASFGQDAHGDHGDSRGDSRSSANSSRPASRITKKQIKDTNNHILRFKKGEWQYANVPEAVVQKELAGTELREIQENLEIIAEEKARGEPIKWHV